jgi:hypothetical protein
MYFAMAFSIGVEMLNIRLRRKKGAVTTSVKLRKALPRGADRKGADAP